MCARSGTRSRGRGDSGARGGLGIPVWSMPDEEILEGRPAWMYPSGARGPAREAHLHLMPARIMDRPAAQSMPVYEWVAMSGFGLPDAGAACSAECDHAQVR